MKIEDSVAVVTGGASGLGEATARRLLDGGARAVVALDVNAERGKDLTAELGDRYRFARTDITDPDEVEAVLADAREIGEVRIVVNAAAIAAPAKLLSRKGPIPLETFDKGIKVNLYGPLHVMRAAVPGMAENEPQEDGERGVIVNVSSGAAWEGQIGQVSYSASKAALVGMTLPLSRELAEHGIRVMTIAPGAFDTPMYAQVPPSVKEGLIAQSLFPKRMGHADEFAMLVEEIVRNPMHNGRTIRLDGGVILSPS
ncbi:SDR family NAD(P)-dependent oxidoreductase [Nocardiopsis eucommiae]|uniref:SDR family NAD(P)-dependent oxidoreductase n=1 Tax=Nocardiopsis eucommiae TaxID=2831970 RepID=UPI003D70495B